MASADKTRPIRPVTPGRSQQYREAPASKNPDSVDPKLLVVGKRGRFEKPVIDHKQAPVPPVRKDSDGR